MWALTTSRREILDLFLLRRSSEDIKAVEVAGRFLAAVSPNVTTAIWPCHPRDFGALPSTIVVPESELRDFIAWIGTYAREFRPLTSFCRIVTRPIAEHFLMAPPVPFLGSAQGICAGLVIGETLAQSNGKIDHRELPSSAYPATLSYVLSRALAITGTTDVLEHVLSLWTRTKELAGQPQPTMSPASVASIWFLPFATTSNKYHTFNGIESADLLSEAWRQLASCGEITESVWDRLTIGLSEFRPMRNMVRLTREKRLELVDTGLRLLALADKDGSDRKAFLAGYITSMLSPGTLDHAAVLAPIAGRLPAAFVWYGLFAGLELRGGLLSIANPTARRIIRDLTAPDRLMDRPRCDISIDELSIIGTGEGLHAIKGARSGRLDVELLPGVTTSIRWPQQDLATAEESRHVRDAEIQRLLSDLEDIALRHRLLTDRLRHGLGIKEAQQSAAAIRRKRPRA